LALADQSLRYAVAACEFAVKVIMDWEGESIPFMAGDSLLASIALFYARPFTHNEFPGVLPKKWARYSNQKMQKAHHEMIACRHEIFAHSDPTVHKMNIIPAGVPLKQLNRDASHITYTVDSYSIPPSRIATWHETCTDLQGRLQEACFEMIEELYGSLELPKRQFPLRFNDGL